MNKELWKDCLEIFPYDFIITLIAATKTKVHGFSNPIPQNRYLKARGIIHNTLLRNQNALFKQSKQMVEDKEWDKYRSQSIHDLIQQVSQNRDELPAILLSLLTSDEKEHAIVAQLLLDKLPSLESNNTTDTEQRDQDSIQVDNNSHDNDSSIKIRQFEKKLERLTEKLNNLQKSNTDLQQQNKNLREELAALKKEYVALSDRYTRESQNWNNERIKFEKLSQRETAISDTHAEDTNMEKITIHTHAPRVILIGDKNKHVEGLSQTLQYRIRIYDSREINQENNKILEDCDEIWILKRDLSISQRRKIERQFKDRIIIFDNLIELDKHISGGNHS